MKADFIGPIGMVGLPDGLTIEASNIKVALNGAQGTIPALPSAINWVTSVNEDGNSVNNTSFAADADAVEFHNGAGDLIETIDLEVGITAIGGTLTLDVFGYLEATATFELTRRVVDVDVDEDGFGTADATPADDMANASLLTVDLAITDMFIGVPGSVGISVSEGNLTLAMLKADPLTAPSDLRSYTALMTSVGGASLVGIPGIEVNVVSLAYESNLYSVPDTGPLNWGNSIDLQPGSATFVSDPVYAGDTLIDPDIFLLQGELNLSIGEGFVLASGQFDIDIRNAQTEGGAFDVTDDVVTVTNANVLNINLEHVFLFVGVNGAFVKDADGSVTGLDTDDAIGFSVSEASLALAIISETSNPLAPGPVASYTGIRVEVTEMAVHGLPDTFEFAVRDLVFLLNVPYVDVDLNETRLDWDQLTEDGVVTGLEDVDSSVNISVAGYLEINIAGFVLAAGHFSIEQSLVDGFTDGPLTFDASVLTIELSNIYVFAGINGAFTHDVNGYANGFVEAADTVGIAFSDGDLTLAIVGEILPTGATGPARSWMGIAATLGSLDVIGLPSGFELSGKDFSFRYNQASTGATPTKLDWQNIDQFDATLLHQLSSTTELFVAGHLLISIDGFVYVAGAVTLEKRELQVKTTDTTVAGTQTVSALIIGAKNVKAFVGVGGPYYVDLDGLDNDGDTVIDEPGEIDPVGAMGVTLELKELALVLMKTMPANPVDALSYTAVRASGAAAIVGIDDFVLNGQLDVAMNMADINDHVVDFAASAALNPALFGSSDGLRVQTGTDAENDFAIVDFERELLEISGALTLQIASYVYLSGQFAFSKAGPVDVILSDASIKENMSVLRIGASDVDAFVGVGGPYFVDKDGLDNDGDTLIDEAGEIQPDGAMGVVLSDLEIALALVKPVVEKNPTTGLPVGPVDNSSYYALTASGGVEIVGIDAVTIRADILTVSVNGGTDGVVSTLNDPVINFAASAAAAEGTEQEDIFGSTVGLMVLTGPDPDGSGSELAPSRLIDFDAGEDGAYGWRYPDNELDATSTSGSES